MKRKLIIEKAVKSDVPELLSLYAYYVLHTAVTFDYEVPSPEAFADKLEKTLRQYPFLTARTDGRIAGYAYTSPFVGRAAYGWAAETTIYVKEDRRGEGVGRALYETLEDISRAQGICNLNACIGYPETEDEYLTDASVRFHRRMGYQMAGMFHDCGYKFGRWYHMVWMEKILGRHPAVPGPVVPFPELDENLCRREMVQIWRRDREDMI